jgi:hypothetical protein
MPNNSFSHFITLCIIYSVKIIGGILMGDLSATNCGCNNNSGLFGDNSCCTWIIILILLFACGGCGNGTSLFGGNDCGNGNSCCTWIIILILLFTCGGCGNNNNGCGCGC